MLNSSFPRNITLLRKERGLSQKSVVGRARRLTGAFVPL